MSQPATSVAVVVLGMHRSGTSALTGLLGLLGVELGSNLHPANEFNQAGYFEHLDLLDVHERLFRALGSSWDDPRPLPLGWPQVPAVQELQ
ncbi:MAG TPA: sulfotransferase family protein, partial [Vicinamibacteria bacterium]|nr:sulfotransferase family protein [Vicinamibacteria bacterium]